MGSAAGLQAAGAQGKQWMYCNVIMQNSQLMIPLPDAAALPERSPTAPAKGLMFQWSSLRLGYFFGGDNESLFRVNADKLSAVAQLPGVSDPQVRWHASCWGVTTINHHESVQAWRIGDASHCGVPNSTPIILRRFTNSKAPRATLFSAKHGCQHSAAEDYYARDSRRSCSLNFLAWLSAVVE